MLYGQLESLPEEKQRQIEIIFLIDNKTISLGEKRNMMVDIAKGEYVTHVDSDDRITTDYLISLLDAIESGADAITFQVSVTLNGGKAKICKYSKEYKRDYNTPIEYRRIPNHICCVKKEVSLKSSYPSIPYGEDAAYAKLLLPHIKTEHKINRVLYHYDFNENTTETQEHISADRIRKQQSPPVMDVIILSRAKSDYYRKMCQNTIDTCIKGANGLPVNVVVIEQEAGVIYNNARTIYHDAPFAYNSFMNLGARSTSAPWVMFANNDLIFTDGWAHNLLSANYPVVSPKEPNDPRQRGVIKNEKGYTNGRNLAGWCFAMKREVWERIGGLDEDFNGWFADDATIEQCKAIGIAPMLVVDSVVKHLGSKTLSDLQQDERDELCWGQLELFNRKYKQNKFHDNPHYKAWKRRSNK